MQPLQQGAAAATPGPSTSRGGENKNWEVPETNWPEWQAESYVAPVQVPAHRQWRKEDWQATPEVFRHPLYEGMFEDGRPILDEGGADGFPRVRPGLEKMALTRRSLKRRVDLAKQTFHEIKERPNVDPRLVEKAKNEYVKALTAMEIGKN